MSKGLAPTDQGRPVEAPAALIPACLAGDAQARESLARWCLNTARRTVLLTYGTGPDADDLVQSATARVFSRLDRFHGDDRFSGWVNKITVNVMRDFFRSRKSRWSKEVLSDTVEDRPATRGQPDQHTEQQWVMERLAEHLRSIKLTRREPLALSLAHGYTVAEIADILNVNAGAAKKRLQRGRSQLVDLLKSDPCFCEIAAEWIR